jgi:hypothetical protein
MPTVPIFVPICTKNPKKQAFGAAKVSGFFEKITFFIHKSHKTASRNSIPSIASIKPDTA